MCDWRINEITHGEHIFRRSRPPGRLLSVPGGFFVPFFWYVRYSYHFTTNILGGIVYGI